MEGEEEESLGIIYSVGGWEKSGRQVSWVAKFEDDDSMPASTLDSRKQMPQRCNLSHTLYRSVSDEEAKKKKRRKKKVQCGREQ